MLVRVGPVSAGGSNRVDFDAMDLGCCYETLIEGGYWYYR